MVVDKFNYNFDDGLLSSPTMKILGIVLICLLAGCTTLDGLAGVRSDGTGDSGGGPVGATADWLKSFGGVGAIAGGILGLVGSGYGAWRAKRYGKIAASVIEGVHKIRNLKSTNGKISLTEENLCEILRAAQIDNGTTRDVNKIISRIEKSHD